MIASQTGEFTSAVSSSTPCHEVDVKHIAFKIDPELKDMFKLSTAELSAILKAVNDKRDELESRKNPPAGYKLIIMDYQRGSNAIEVVLEAIWGSEPGQALEVPKNPAGCGLCKATGQMTGYEKGATTHARVIKSREGNPLAITNDHYDHFFLAPLEVQVDLVKTAIAVIFLSDPESSRHDVKIHIGKAGHQTAGHLHAHAAGAYGRECIKA